MASIESLPPDQRAVLQLVLQRGRSYDDIAQLLSIDRGAVRQRAHAALDALGPGTRVDADRRAQISDYLLGQQTEAEAAQTRERMAGSASERAWGRVVASELAPFASGSLPEIPAEGAHEPPATAPSAAPELGEALGAIQPEPAPRETPQAAEPAAAAASGSSTPPAGDNRPVSRRGGAILIAAAAAVVVIVVVVVLIANGGSSKSNTPSASTPATTPASTPTGSTASTGSTGSTGTTGSSAKVLAQFNLSSPTSKKTIGIAQFLQAGSQYGIAVVAENVAPNTKKNAYAVWLYNSPGHAELLGFVNPGVGSTKRLSTAGPLPANASQYHELLVTLETQSKPKAPGTIVLQGQVTLSHGG
jgi:Sigma-70, region 4